MGDVKRILVLTDQERDYLIKELWESAEVIGISLSMGWSFVTNVRKMQEEQRLAIGILEKLKPGLSSEFDEVHFFDESIERDLEELDRKARIDRLAMEEEDKYIDRLLDDRWGVLEEEVGAESDPAPMKIFGEMIMISQIQKRRKKKREKAQKGPF